MSEHLIAVCSRCGKDIVRIDKLPLSYEVYYPHDKDEPEHICYACDKVIEQEEGKAPDYPLCNECILTRKGGEQVGK